MKNRNNSTTGYKLSLRFVRNFFSFVLCILCLISLFGCSEQKQTKGVLHQTDADYVVAFQGGAYRIIRIENIKSSTLTFPSYYERNPITSVAQGALENCLTIKRIVLSDTINEMDYLSINGCENIESIHIGAGMKSYNNGFISGCKNLKMLTVSENNSFLVVKENCLISPDNLILYAAAMTDTIPLGITTINDSAFSNLPIATIQIPEGVLQIGSYAFEGTNLTEIRIPNTVWRIGDYTFANTHITELTIPDSIVSIGKWCFAHMGSIESINLGAGVRDLSCFCFAYDSALSQITVSDGNPQYYSKDNCLLERETNRVVFCGNQFTIPECAKILGNGCMVEDIAQAIDSVRIPRGVELIESGAFSGSLGNIKVIYIPETVITMGEYAIVLGIGDDHIVFCEAKLKPTGWDEKWLTSIGQTEIVWDAKLNY